MANIYDYAVLVGQAKPDWSQDGAKLNYYRIPIDKLFYNEDNGRIATWISEYKNTNGDDSVRNLDKEDLNNLIHEFIKKSNTPASFSKTYTDIKEKGQIRPGVVLADGRIVSGNRRFTILRELYRDTYNDQYKFFECFILDKNLNNANDRVEIKTIETITQFGVDEKVDYDPIDRLVDVYNALIGPNRYFTQKEYQVKLRLSKSDVLKMYKKAELMADYLDYINSSGKFFIARANKLDGPLQELSKKPFSEMEKAEWYRIREVFYRHFPLSNEGDRSRKIRQLAKMYVENRAAFDRILMEIIMEHEQIEHYEHSTNVSTNSNRAIPVNDQKLVPSEKTKSFPQFLLM